MNTLDLFRKNVNYGFHWPQEQRTSFMCLSCAVGCCVLFSWWKEVILPVQDVSEGCYDFHWQCVKLFPGRRAMLVDKTLKWYDSLESQGVTDISIMALSNRNGTSSSYPKRLRSSAFDVESVNILRASNTASYLHVGSAATCWTLGGWCSDVSMKRV